MKEFFLVHQPPPHLPRRPICMQILCKKRQNQFASGSPILCVSIDFFSSIVKNAPLNSAPHKLCGWGGVVGSKVNIELFNLISSMDFRLSFTLSYACVCVCVCMGRGSKWLGELVCVFGVLIVLFA